MPLRATETVSLFLALILAGSNAIENGLGKTPPLGYNTWNDFGCGNITADNLRLVADKMVELGFRDAGYEYLNIDDCWAIGRDKVTKQLIPDPILFPEGIKPVSDYVHSKGLKFGIYTDRGILTCGKRPGSLGHEMIDAQSFADWGVDFLKEDSCYSNSVDHKVAFKEYARMRDALNATGRPIFFSLCGWRAWYAPLGASLGNTWRISGDVIDWAGVYRAVQVALQLGNYAGPGGFNDPDMLLGSVPDTAHFLTPEQSRTQFNLWVALSSPLLVGSSMLRMSAYDQETYTNPEALSISQDPLAKQGFVAWGDCPQWKPSKKCPPCAQVLSKPLSTGGFALVLANYSPTPNVVACDEACVVRACGGVCAGMSFLARDVWAKKSLGLVQSVEVALPPGGSSMLVFTPPTDPPPPFREGAAVDVPVDPVPLVL